LRRFRRLSRAGRIPSAGYMGPDELDQDPSEVDSDIDAVDNLMSDPEDDGDPNSSMSEESLTSSNISSTVLSHRDVARLEKDEIRLQLDLNRHRQLLIDSQKMNMSLKRCTAITEEMITEARRALEYRVSLCSIYIDLIQLTNNIGSCIRYTSWRPSASARRRWCGSP
jgi:hypothetical protein